MSSPEFCSSRPSDELGTADTTLLSPAIRCNHVNAMSPNGATRRDKHRRIVYPTQYHDARWTSKRRDGEMAWAHIGWPLHPCWRGWVKESSEGRGLCAHSRAAETASARPSSQLQIIVVVAHCRAREVWSGMASSPPSVTYESRKCCQVLSRWPARE